MIYIAYFILSFTVLQMLVSLSNLFWGKFSHKAQAISNIPVSVMIPARNEEKNIANILNDLIKQNYSNIEVMVFDDQSTDKTEGIVREISKKDNRIRILKSEGLPEGWIGKNHACHTMSKEAKGNYFLFLDADVRIGKELIRDTVSFSEKHHTGLLSLFPKQIMLTPAEWATVPSMNYILLTLLPLILVRKSKFASLAAANGQFMLFNARIYNDYKPHEMFRKNMVEDIEISRFFKRKKIITACHTGNDSVRCRMYSNFAEAVKGFSKNVVTYFGNSFLLALLFWLITTFGIILVFYEFSFTGLLIYLIMIVLTRIFISLTSEQNILKNLIYAVLQQIAIGIFIYKAFVFKLNKQYIWKDRNIS